MYIQFGPDIYCTYLLYFPCTSTLSISCMLPPPSPSPLSLPLHLTLSSFSPLSLLQGIDVKSMGRIFIGIVKCGAWGCFDEFNRLEEAVLSAVSMQIQVIQAAIRSHAQHCELLERKVSKPKHTVHAQRDNIITAVSL